MHVQPSRHAGAILMTGKHRHMTQTFVLMLNGHVAINSTWLEINTKAGHSSQRKNFFFFEYKYEILAPKLQFYY